MNKSETQTIKEGLFSMFNIKLPTDELANQALENYIESLDVELCFRAYTDMSNRELKARNQNEIMALFRDFYRMARIKSEQIAKPRVKYQNGFKPYATTELKTFDHEDIRPRANKGRCFMLFLDLNQCKLLKFPEDEDSKKVYTRIENDIYEMLNTLEFSGKANKIEADFYTGGRGNMETRLLINLKEIAPQVQKFIDRFIPDQSSTQSTSQLP